MTGMTGGIIEWAKTQPCVRSIIASTNKSNIASFKVLEKNNFIKPGEKEELFNWKLEMGNDKVADEKTAIEQIS
jgi:[ribosomal protein S5]-alanine N-acetyltransferase